MDGLNFPKVTIKEFKNIIKLQFNENNLRPVFGLGLGGIGKSESIMELAKELNIGYIDIRLLLYNETDLKGIPYPDENHTRTIWLQNNILPIEQRDGKYGILVFDEITSCSRSVRTAAYQLLNERKLGEYTLPKGWIIVCLGNGPEDGGDFNGMEGNFLNRCSVYSVVPSVDAWCEWAVSKGVNPLVIAYIRFKMEDFHTFNPDNDIELFASPRSWKAVSDILNKNADTNDYITQLRIMSNVGNHVGQTFLAFCKFKDQSISVDDIFNGTASPNITNREALLITLNSVTYQLRVLIDRDKPTGMLSEELINKLANSINWLIKLNFDGAAEFKLMTFKDIASYDMGVITRICTSQRFMQLCPDFFQFSSHMGGLL